MRPMVRFIVASAMGSNPTFTRTPLVQSNYPTFKVERIRSAYSRVVRTFARVSKAVEDVASSYPDLLKAFREVKSRLPRLDYNVVIPPSLVHQWFNEVKDTEALSLFAGYDMSRAPAEKQSKVYARAAVRAREVRRSALAYRIEEELTRPGVYPVFWTLTVDPQHEYIIAPGRREFEIWLRKVRRRFGAFRYCCVVERGAEGRLHYHALFIFDDLSHCSDPNGYRPNGSLQEIPEMRGFWPYGLSNPVAVRYSPVDVYGLLGWRWPLGQKSGAPVAVALYQSKYITKATEEVDGCRTKQTRGFGLHKLRLMTQEEALLILQGDPDKFLSRVWTVAKPPAALLTSTAARMLFGDLPRLPLPEMKRGSVSEANDRVTARQSIPMNAGDSIAPLVGSNPEWDRYRQNWSSVRIGKII